MRNKQLDRSNFHVKCENALQPLQRDAMQILCNYTNLHGGDGSDGTPPGTIAP